MIRRGNLKIQVHIVIFPIVLRNGLGVWTGVARAGNGRPRLDVGGATPVNKVLGVERVGVEESINPEIVIGSGSDDVRLERQQKRTHRNSQKHLHSSARQRRVLMSDGLPRARSAADCRPALCGLPACAAADCGPARRSVFDSTWPWSIFARGRAESSGDCPRPCDAPAPRLGRLCM